jgi:Radical SAM superfamily
VATLNDVYTSTGHKFFAHQQAMENLRNGVGQPITTHIMLTDVCQHTCAFCSVQARAGDSLVFEEVMKYLDVLLGYGLKSVILSGGGNPILYKCKQSGKDFNDVVAAIHQLGLEIGLITNGMPLRSYYTSGMREGDMGPEYMNHTRKSWQTVRPETLDKLTWVRISMAGFDHDEHEVYVPDIDPLKTTLGFSYVGHDIYKEPLDPHHGKVSTRRDLLSVDRAPDWTFEERIDELEEQIAFYANKYQPKYVRLLPNCLEPQLIPARCKQLKGMADRINFVLDKEVAFVQQKPPAAPKACYLGYIHPVLNCDGYVYPCDSCVLNEAANHTFANPWRVCHWSQVALIYEQPVRSLIADPKVTCPGCVFSHSNEILGTVVGGTADLTPPAFVPEHANFV